MNNKRLVLLVIIICVIAAAIYARGSRDTPAKPLAKTVQVSGRVRLTGSAPLYNLLITNEDREWYIDPDDQQKLWLLQQQLVTVTAKEYYSDLFFANGAPAGRQYFLKDIKIITQETIGEPVQ
jgi:hypothetical protein